MATKSYLSQVNYGIKGRGKAPPGMSLSPVQVPNMPSEGKTLQNLGDVALKGYDVYQREKLRQKNNDAENLSTELMKEHIPKIESAYLKLMSDKSARNTGERFSKTWGDLTDDHINSIRDDKENDFEGNPESWNRVNSWLTGYFLRLGSQGKQALDARSIVRREEQYKSESKEWTDSTVNLMWTEIHDQGQGSIERIFSSTGPRVAGERIESISDKRVQDMLFYEVRKDTEALIKRHSLALGWDEKAQKELVDSTVRDVLVGVMKKAAFKRPAEVRDGFSVWSEALEKEGVEQRRILEIQNFALNFDQSKNAPETRRQLAGLLSITDIADLDETGIEKQLVSYRKDTSEGEFTAAQMKNRYPDLYRLRPETVARTLQSYKRIRADAVEKVDTHGYNLRIDSAAVSLTNLDWTSPPLVGLTTEEVQKRFPDWTPAQVYKALAQNNYLKAANGISQNMRTDGYQSKEQMKEAWSKIGPEAWTEAAGGFFPGDVNKTNAKAVIANSYGIAHKMHQKALVLLEQQWDLQRAHPVEYHVGDFESARRTTGNENLLFAIRKKDHTFTKDDYWLRIKSQPALQGVTPKDLPELVLRQGSKKERSFSVMPHAGAFNIHIRAISEAKTRDQFIQSIDHFENYLEDYVPKEIHQAALIELFQRIGSDNKRDKTHKYGPASSILAYNAYKHGSLKELDLIMDARESFEYPERNRQDPPKHLVSKRNEIITLLYERHGQFMSHDQDDLFKAMLGLTNDKAGDAALFSFTAEEIVEQMWGDSFGVRSGIEGYSDKVKGTRWHNSEVFDPLTRLPLTQEGKEEFADGLADFMYILKEQISERGPLQKSFLDANLDKPGFQVVIGEKEETLIADPISGAFGRYVSAGSGTRFIFVLERSSLSPKGLEFRVHSLDTKRSYAVTRPDGSPYHIPYGVWSKFTHNRTLATSLSSKFEALASRSMSNETYINSVEKELKLLQSANNLPVTREFATELLSRMPSYRQLLKEYPDYVKEPSAEVLSSVGSGFPLPLSSNFLRGHILNQIHEDIEEIKEEYQEKLGEEGWWHEKFRTIRNQLTTE